MSRAQNVTDEAANWLVRKEEASWTDSDQAEFDEWLGQSEGNKAAYWRLKHTWREADRLGGQDLPAAPAEPARYRPFAMVWLPHAIAASLLLAIGIGFFAARPAPPSDAAEMSAQENFTTAVGARKLVNFPDGSTAMLNTATRMRAAIDAKRREIWLDDGEAFFEVTRRAGETFVVHAGNRRVTVLGTKFAVRRSGEQVTVMVLEGRVKVDEVGQPGPIRSAIISGGDIAIARGEATLVAARSGEKVESALAWREGMLNFDQKTLAEAAAEFNRYNHVQLVVGDQAIGATRIGGMFPANQPDAFARLLRDAYGLTIEQDDQTIRVSN